MRSDPPSNPLHDEPASCSDRPLVLCDDLAALASRLQAESEDLARSYPTQDPSRLGLDSQNHAFQLDARPATSWLTTALALVLVAAFGFAFGRWHLLARQSDLASASTTPEPPVRSLSPAASESAPGSAPKTREVVSSPTRPFSDKELDTLARVLADLPADARALGETLAIEDAIEDATDPNPPPALSEADKIRLLEKALERYRSVIVYLQSQLERQVREQAQAEQAIADLKAEINTLRAGR